MSEIKSYGRWLGGVAVAGLLALLIVGALVNSRQAALSVPDWPKSYGQWILIGEAAGNAVLEHSHRLLAAGVGLLVAAFGVAMLRGPYGRRAKRSSWLLIGLYLAQVLMGGAVVLTLNPPWLSALHSLTAQAVFALAFLIVTDPWAVHGTTGGRAGGLSRRQRRLARATATLVVLQVVLGALSRHPEVQIQFIVTLLSHIAIGLALAVLTPITAISILRRSRGPTRAAAALLLALIVVQLAVAVPLFIVSPEPMSEEWPPPAGFPALHAAHVALAALLLSSSLWLAIAVARHDRARDV